MSDIDARELDPASTYRLLVGSVLPRPIAWVTTGLPPKPVNVAPFSSFTWVSQHPAMLGFTVNRRRDGRKDTLNNAREDGEFVVNIAGREMLSELHASSEWFGPEVSEAEVVGLELEPSKVVAVPRLAGVPISMECVLERVIEFSPTGGEFVVGRVVSWHLRDDVLENGRIVTERVQPIGRLAGPRYSVLGEIIELPPVPGG